MKKIHRPPLYLFICIALIVCFHFVFPQYNLIPFPFNFIGTVIAFAGFFTMYRSSCLFKKYQTTFAIEESSHIITEGVFSKTRNPMYVGMFVLLLGMSICFMNLFSIFASFLFIVLIRFIFIPKEEKLMLEVFGDEYIDYKSRVRRWI